LLALGLLALRPFPLDALALLFRALLLCLGFRLARGRRLALLLLPFARSLRVGWFPPAQQHLRALLACQVGEETGAVAHEEKVPTPLASPRFPRLDSRCVGRRYRPAALRAGQRSSHPSRRASRT